MPYRGNITYVDRDTFKVKKLTLAPDVSWTKLLLAAYRVGVQLEQAENAITSVKLTYKSTEEEL